MYIYPDNLRAKASLFLWTLDNIAIIGVGFLLSAFSIAQLGLPLPLVMTAVYAFLTIRLDETTILDFIRYAFAFFIGKQQLFFWRARV